jgi:Domain of unknown function (DUF4133)
MATVYDINKGINRGIEFKGLKAQYVIYLAVGIILLFLSFTILYVCGLKFYYCLGVVVPVAIAFITTIQRLSNTYGQYGLIKKMARRKLPVAVRSMSRKPFILLKSETNEKGHLA